MEIRCTIFLILTLVMGPFNIHAQAQSQQNTAAEEVDTIGRDLKEVVVRGRTQRVIENGVSYIPDRNSRKFAIDAVDLLTNMQIPQLKVTADRDVRTASNQEVRIFIDYAEASAADLSGIRTEDVARVEVLDYPADVRFHQAEHVVNFIMRRYDWGGYTKLTAGGKLLNDDDVSGNLYSKFSYRRWTFDVNGSGRGAWERHGKGETLETFRDFGFKGTRYEEVTRASENYRQRERSNAQNAGLRAVYSKDNVYVSHSVAYSRRETPHSSVNSRVGFSGGLLPESQASREDRSGMQEVWATGNYYFSLPRRNNISATWTVGRQRYHDYSDYRLAGEDPISNRQNATFHYPQISVSHSKDLGHGNSINTTADSYMFFHDKRYRGSADTRDKTVTSSTQLLVSYRQRWNFGLSVSVRAGARYNWFREDGADRVHRWSPYIHASVSYAPDSRNWLSLSGAWFSTPARHDMTSEATVRRDELLWSRGNPDLRPGNKKWVMLSYTLMPLENLSLTAYGLYYDNSDMPVYDFRVREGYDGLIRTYSGDGRERNLECSVSGSLRLFGNSLSLGGDVTVNRQWNRGLLDMNNTCVTGRVNARWYHRNFSAGLYYRTRDRSIFDRQGYEVRTPCSYGLDLTYSLRDFKAGLQFSNWFSQGYVRSTYDSPLYSEVSRAWSRIGSRSLMLTLSYTFQYGKRVNRDNELNTENGPALGF